MIPLSARVNLKTVKRGKLEENIFEDLVEKVKRDQALSYSIPHELGGRKPLK